MAPDITLAARATTISSKNFKFFQRLRAAFLCLALCFCIAGPAVALTGQELFDDGNRLFRNELYWAALLRYRQAGEAGFASPLLDYNSGIAHYHARQYERARDALTRALETPSLRTAAQYNLGLTEMQMGNYEAALRWMRLVREQQGQPKLVPYANEAMARIQILWSLDEPELADLDELRKPERKVTHFDLRAQVGFGTDDNVFRTPDINYIDFADPAFPIITPEPVSGVYMPFEFFTKYKVDPYKDEGFFGAYRLEGVTYQEKDLNDADEYAHEIAVGSEYHTLNEDGDREREVYSAFTIAQHEETYFDPSTGTYFFVETDDGEIEYLDQRMDYVRYGPELNFRQRLSNITFGFGAKAQLWNYDDTGFVPEYDHEYFVLNLLGEYQFSPTSLLRLVAAKSSRRFGDRPAYNLDAELLVGNPTLRYDYLDFGLEARQRITESLWFSLEYLRRERSDKFEGYNDYTRNQYGATLQWRFGRNFEVLAGGWYALYDYPNAFAFNNIMLPRKTLEMLDINLVAQYHVTPNIDIVFEANHIEKASNDARNAYERELFSLSVRWHQ